MNIKLTLHYLLAYQETIEHDAADSKMGDTPADSFEIEDNKLILNYSEVDREAVEHVEEDYCRSGDNHADSFDIESELWLEKVG